MEENKTTFSGFEAVMETLSPRDKAGRTDDNDSTIPYIDPSELMDDIADLVNKDIINNTDDDEPVIKQTTAPIKKSNDKKVQVVDSLDFDDDIVDDLKTDDDTTNNDVVDDVTINNNVDSLDEFEKDIVGFITNKFSDQLGWNITEDSKIETVDDVVNYINDIVEENSKPVYPNEEVERLAKFVEDGGNLLDFYKEVYSDIDPNKVDLEKEIDQKNVVRQNFSNLGYSSERINKMISRYEESGTLQEEAEDAIESLKEFNKKRAEKLLKEQEIVSTQAKERQQKFFSDVETNITSVQDIRGVPINDRDKKQLLDYIFKIESDGTTKYQKEYKNRGALSLIESAYFTMKGDSLIKQVEKKATSNATKELKEKLKQRNVNNRNKSNLPDDTDNKNLSFNEMISHFSSQLSKKR